MQLRKCLPLGLLLLLPGLLEAGQICGSVSSSGARVNAAAIEIVCGQEVTRGATARDGSYRINVVAQGQCKLQLAGYKGIPSIVVFSYANPSQYDLNLIPHADGTYELRKR